MAARDAQLQAAAAAPRGLQRLLSKLPMAGLGQSSAAATQQRQAAAAAAVAEAEAAAAAAAGEAVGEAETEAPASAPATPVSPGSPAGGWAPLGAAWPFGQYDAPKTGQPMFCLELAVRLYAWAKYAYRHWVSRDSCEAQAIALWVWLMAAHACCRRHLQRPSSGRIARPPALLPLAVPSQPDSTGGMSRDHVMRLFDLPPDSFDALLVPGTDSRAVLGWRRGGGGAADAVVCAFRGTSSRANMVTDIKVGCLAG